MIDFFIRIRFKEEKGIVCGKPFDKVPFFNRYLRYTNETKVKNIYYFTNCHNNSCHAESFVEKNGIVFFLFGEVNYRNANASQNQTPPSINDVLVLYESGADLFKIIKGNYAFVLFRRAELEVEILNSPFGVIPLNYSISDGEVCISTSLTLIKAIIPSATINTTALLQLSMFDTILGNNTLVNEIKQLQYGQKVCIGIDRVVIKKIYDHSELFREEPISRRNAIGELVHTLKTNSENWPTKGKVLFGLTGGFDCRLNLSLIPEGLRSNIIAYTYGMSGSEEIKIARKISETYNLHHEIIELGYDFEEKYSNLADEVIILGDGFTPYMRANYLYAHSQLAKQSNHCITGMYGSEFIKPIHVLPDSVSINSPTVNAFLSESINDSLTSFFHQLKVSNRNFYSSQVFSSSNLDETIALIETDYSKPGRFLNRDKIVYDFYLNEGMRKFFMEIIRIDRYFISHTLPYLDLDFLELLLKSEYAGVHNNIFRGILKRRKGQLFYADAMAILDPGLNNIPVDRGYKPRYLRSDLGWLYVAAGYLVGKKMRRVLKGNTTYNQRKWGREVFTDNLKIIRFQNRLFNENLFTIFQSGEYLKNTHLFGRHYSVKKWLHSNGLIG